MKKIKKLLCCVLVLIVLMSTLSIDGFAAKNVDLYDGRKVLLIQNDLPWGFSSNTRVLKELNANYSVTTTSEFSASMLANYGVVILANDQTTDTYSDYTRFTSELELFAQNGGVVVYGACDEGSGHGGKLSSNLPGGVTKYFNSSEYNYIEYKNHPIVTGVLTDEVAINDNDLYSNYCSHTCFNEDTLPVGANVILRAKSNGAPTLVEYPCGEGIIIASGLTWEWGYDESKSGNYSKKAMDDYFAYAITYYNSTIDFVVDNVGVRAGYKYNDTFFNKSAYIYNHELAKASIGLATAAMVDDGGDYSKKEPAAAKELFDDLDFDNYTPYGYNKKPTENSIACVFANKNVDATKTSIVVIAVRGSGYEGEWSGNFNIGNSVNHAGFDIAKKTVINHLVNFLSTDSKKIKYKDNVKFWITGYSRAAATANLVSACLDDVRSNNGILIDEDACYNLSEYSFGPESVFAYTFETPRNTRNSNAKAAKYGNIFNIVNRDDIVPRVAPAAWGYARFGKDCYLPSKENSTSDYDSLYEKMKVCYSAVDKKSADYNGSYCFLEIKIGASIFTSTPYIYVKENESIERGVFLDNMVNYLVSTIFRSPSNYVKKYQDTIMDIAYTIYGNPKLDEAIRSEGFGNYVIDRITSVFSLGTLTVNPLKQILKEALFAFGSDAGLTYKEASKLVDKLDWILVALMAHPNYLLTFLSNLGNMFVPHFPATTIAWMLTVDGNYKDGGSELSKILTGGETYRVATINCPVDIEVYDSEGVLRGAIINDEVQKIKNGISAYIDENGQKVFCLGNEEEYTFSIVGTGTGTMSCSFSDYNFDICQKQISKNYYDIPITTDTSIMAVLDVHSDVGVEQDVIMYDANTGDVFEPSDVVNAENEDQYAVSVASNSEISLACGGGEFYKGEYVQVTAFSDPNEAFIGWYENETKVSSDITYKFRVESDHSLTAKFIAFSMEDVSLNYKETKIINPFGDQDMSGYIVSYSSSDPNVVSVDDTGKFYASKKGDATVTCTLTDALGDTISKTCNVKVSYTWWQWLIKIVLFGWIWY